MQADGGAKLTIDTVSEWIRTHPDGAAIGISVVALGVAVVAYRKFNAHSDRSGVIESATCHVCTGRGMHADDVCDVAGLRLVFRSLVSVAFGLGAIGFMLVSLSPVGNVNSIEQAGAYAQATWAAVVSGICLMIALRMSDPLRSRRVLRCNRCGYTVPRS